MGTQDFPLHFPNHETTLNAKAFVGQEPQVGLNVVKSATLECPHLSSRKALQCAHYRGQCSHWTIYGQFCACHGCRESGNTSKKGIKRAFQADYRVPGQQIQAIQGFVATSMA